MRAFRRSAAARKVEGGNRAWRGAGAAAGVDGWGMVRSGGVRENEEDEGGNEEGGERCWS